MNKLATKLVAMYNETMAKKAEEELIEVGWGLGPNDEDMIKSTAEELGEKVDNKFWERINEDISNVENDFLKDGYKKFFTKVRDEGHDSNNDLGGTAWMTKQQLQDFINKAQKIDAQNYGLYESAGELDIYAYHDDALAFHLEMYIDEDTLGKLNIEAKKVTKKATKTLEEVAGLIDTILDDFDHYDYVDQLEIGEKSHYESILADLQKDEKGIIESVFNRVSEDDDTFISDELDQLKEYYNNKFVGKKSFHSKVMSKLAEEDDGYYTVWLWPGAGYTLNGFATQASGEEAALYQVAQYLGDNGLHGYYQTTDEHFDFYKEQYPDLSDEEISEKEFTDESATYIDTSEGFIGWVTTENMNIEKGINEKFIDQITIIDGPRKTSSKSYRLSKRAFHKTAGEFEEMMKLKSTDPKLIKYLANEFGVEESTVSQYTDVSDNAEELYNILEEQANKYGYEWDKYEYDEYGDRIDEDDFRGDTEELEKAVEYLKNNIDKSMFKFEYVGTYEDNYLTFSVNEKLIPTEKPIIHITNYTKNYDISFFAQSQQSKEEDKANGIASDDNLTILIRRTSDEILKEIVKYVNIELPKKIEEQNKKQSSKAKSLSKKAGNKEQIAEEYVKKYYRHEMDLEDLHSVLYKLFGTYKEAVTWLAENDERIKMSANKTKRVNKQAKIELIENVWYKIFGYPLSLKYLGKDKGGRIRFEKADGTEVIFDADVEIEPYEYSYSPFSNDTQATKKQADKVLTLKEAIGKDESEFKKMEDIIDYMNHLPFDARKDSWAVEGFGGNIIDVMNISNGEKATIKLKKPLKSRYASTKKQATKFLVKFIVNGETYKKESIGDNFMEATKDAFNKIKKTITKDKIDFLPKELSSWTINDFDDIEVREIDGYGVLTSPKYTKEDIKENLYKKASNIKIAKKETNKQATIKHENGVYNVYSESGKCLGKGYKTKEEAEKRLKQVEYFKHKNATRTTLRDVVQKVATTIKK